MPIDYEWGKHGWEFKYEGMFLGAVGERAVKYREIMVNALDLNFSNIRGYPVLMSTITDSLPRNKDMDHLSKDEAWFCHLNNSTAKKVYVGEKVSERRLIGVPDVVTAQTVIDAIRSKYWLTENGKYRVLKTNEYCVSVNSHCNLLNCYISMKKFMKKPSTMKLMKIEDTSSKFGI